MIEYAWRRNRLPAPPRVVWESLSQPRRARSRQWLRLSDGEVEPRVLESVEGSRVVWSTLWTDRPDGTIAFDLEQQGDNAGRPGYDTVVRYGLVAGGSPPDEARVKALRHRVSELIFAELRDFYDN